MVLSQVEGKFLPIRYVNSILCLSTMEAGWTLGQFKVTKTPFDLKHKSELRRIVLITHVWETDVALP